MYEIVETQVFARWLDKLKDIKAKISMTISSFCWSAEINLRNQETS